MFKPDNHTLGAVAAFTLAGAVIGSGGTILIAIMLWWFS